MANRKHSLSALAYLRKKRESAAYATWFDVADAYDAGMKHALEATASARRSMKEREARAGVGKSDG